MFPFVAVLEHKHRNMHERGKVATVVTSLSLNGQLATKVATLLSDGELVEFNSVTAHPPRPSSGWHWPYFIPLQLFEIEGEKRNKSTNC
jgi:hypothetical protein